jgi:Asp-tRNA(Asn)/Glu-tRNA(Gln) amidotransferase A subunit family amidase
MLQNDLALTPAWQLREWIGARKVSPVEVVELYLRRIQALNPRLNAFLTVCGDEALAEARRAEEAVVRGGPLGPLHGVPVPIKDLQATAGIRTTRGSLLFRDFVPETDEPLVQRIRRSGAIILGKTNTPEFGHRGTTENLLGEPCRNPWDLERTAGGSSGGAAAAVAAGLCPMAQGTDAGGSIRIPAGFCGVYGIKPTQGRVPRPYRGPGGWGVIGQSGPLCWSVRDAALLLQVMAGPHPDDPTTLPEAPPEFAANLGRGVAGLRIAWSPDLGGIPVDPEVKSVSAKAARVFAELGATVEQPSFALDAEVARQTFRTIFLSDMDANFGRLLDTQADRLMPTVRDWLQEARGWPAARLARALRELQWHRARIEELFRHYDLLLTPTLAVTAFPIEQRPEVIAGVPVDPWWGFTPFTYLFNMTGQPAATVPCGFSTQKLPIGLHIVGRLGEEVTVLQASAAFEAARPWAGHRPPMAWAS